MTDLWLPKFVFVHTTKKVVWEEDTLGEALALWSNYAWCTLEKEYPNGYRQLVSTDEMMIPWALRR